MGQIIGISGYRYRQSSLERVRTLAIGTLVTRGSGPNSTPRFKWRTREDVAEADKENGKKLLLTWHLLNC